MYNLDGPREGGAGGCSSPGKLGKKASQLSASHHTPARHCCQWLRQRGCPSAAAMHCASVAPRGLLLLAKLATTSERGRSSTTSLAVGSSFKYCSAYGRCADHTSPTSRCARTHPHTELTIDERRCRGGVHSTECVVHTHLLQRGGGCGAVRVGLGGGGGRRRHGMVVTQMRARHAGALCQRRQRRPRGCRQRVVPRRRVAALRRLRAITSQSQSQSQSQSRFRRESTLKRWCVEQSPCKSANQWSCLAAASSRPGQSRVREAPRSTQG